MQAVTPDVQGSIDALAASINGSLPLIVTKASSTQLYFPSMTGTLTQPSSDAAFGKSAAWATSGDPLFVLGDPSLRQVNRYTWLQSSTMLAPSGATIFDPSSDPQSDFGRVVAMGNIHPTNGEEIIVSAPALGLVYVFTALGVPIYRLDMGVNPGTTGTKFGAALAVEPGDAGAGLRALWVGQPTNDRIYRFVGDAGNSFEAQAAVGRPLNAGFGASLAVEPSGALIIGAPEYGDPTGTNAVQQGAVYRQSLPHFGSGVLNGVAQACTVGAECQSNCRVGACYGGVMCINLAPLGCPSGFVCQAGAGCQPIVSADAGVPVDAGTVIEPGVDAGAAVDAGVVHDAGVVDAGAVLDAGTAVDAGLSSDAGTDTVQFAASGCQATLAGPLVLLALTLARRRRSSALQE